MRKNEYTSLEQFTSQYIGEWNPSENNWFGLDFIFNNKTYRLNTGYMYDDDLKLNNGIENMFYLYQKKEIIEPDKKEYALLGQYSDMTRLLESKVIDSIPFKDVILHEDTELIGQD